MGAKSQTTSRARRSKPVRPPQSLPEEASPIPVNGEVVTATICRGSSHIVGGMKRRKQTGGGMSQLGRSVLIPPELARSRGYRFPSDKATKDQVQALDKLTKKYLQQQFVKMFPRVGAKAIAAALNCGDSTAFALVKQASMAGDPWDDLVETVLLGMHNRQFAGPLGTPKTDTTKWLFEKIHSLGSNRISRHATPESAALGQLLAAFRVDFYEWRKGR